MRKVKKYLLIIVISIVVLFSGSLILKDNDKKDINRILATPAYSYLSANARDYIKEVYEQTGVVLLTEKNKKENTPYLNPKYIAYLDYSEEEQEQLGEIPISLIVDYSSMEYSEVSTLPSSYDLRNVDGMNYVTPVRDQGDLGICWTFATAGAMESHLLKINNTSYSPTSQLISERQMDYITSVDGILDYKSEYVSFVDRTLGGGGNFYISTIAMANGVSGVDYQSFKAYDDQDFSKMELSDVINYSNSLYEVNSTINVPVLNYRESTDNLTAKEKLIRTSYLNEVKTNIIKNGAAYVATYVNTSCAYVEPSLQNYVIDVYNCPSIGGHAMQIIGWDDDLEYTYCADTTKHQSNISNCNNIVSGKGLWILKNSWGDSIQYLYLAYDSLNTQIHFIDELENSADKDWDNNYILDSGVMDGQEITYFLTNTKIKEEETIQKVKFITESSNALYTVLIYKEDGTFESFSKRSDLPGLITIDISKDIVVGKDSKIVITSDDGWFIDKLSIFTTNIDKTPYIDIEKYDNQVMPEYPIRLYSNTKNIESGSTVTYKLYNLENEDISDKVSISNNIVAENNINTLVNFSNELDIGTYRMDLIYKEEVIASMKLVYTKLQGIGTKDDPYIITSPYHLDQMRNDLDAYYELGSDIDLTQSTHQGGNLSVKSSVCSEEFGWEAINGFHGSLDGKGHTIKGLYQSNYIKCDEAIEWNNNGNGLFGTTYGNVNIKNLVLEDFDITCQGGNCGALVSKYRANNGISSDTTEYTATFENIAIRNSKMNGVYNSYSSTNNSTYGGGLFGEFVSHYGNINFSNIYLDFDMENEDISTTAYLIYCLQGKNVGIKNIQMQGNLTGKSEDGSKDAILTYQLVTDGEVEIKNILSTIDGKNLGGHLFGTILGEANHFNVDGVNLLIVPNKQLFYRFDNQSNASINHVNLYNKDSELVELTKKDNYEAWEDFDNNWVIETINGIPRIPVLKFVDFEYTNIPDILVKQKLNEKVSLYDYIFPNIESAKRIIYKSNDESIVKLDEDGTILPQRSGNTTIHIESLYDGYINDVPITIEYLPHYNVYFDANGGEGTMNSIEVSIENGYTLPENIFTKEHYEFNGWNTKADGTGEAYATGEQIETLRNGEAITLYAQWIGEELTVTFDANGGTVSIPSKKVRYGETYEELPIPIRDGYGFKYWYSGTVAIHSTSTVKDLLNLVAEWEENAYTIVFDKNGGTGELVHTYALFGEDKQLFANTYTKEGCKFKEWNTSPDGTGTSYQENQTIHLSSVDNSLFTLYAIWEHEKGKITFHSNDEFNSVSIQEYTYHVDTRLNKNIFTRLGYRFKEWNTSPDGTGVSYQDEQTINLAKDITLYAIWEEEFDYVIDNYSVDKVNQYISKIMVHTTVDDFKKNIELNTNYRVEVDSKTIDNKSVLFTGGKTKIYKEESLYAEFTNIVIGDINGDGAINSADLLKVRQHLLQTKILSGEYYLASDINYDDTINSADLLRVRQHLLGTKPIS